MTALIRRLPVSWQTRFWIVRHGRSLHAIRELRRTADLPLKEARDRIMGPYYTWR